MIDDVDMDGAAPAGHSAHHAYHSSSLDTLALTATLLAPADPMSGSLHSAGVGIIPVGINPTSASLPPLRHTPVIKEGPSVGDPRLLCVDEGTIEWMKSATHDDDMLPTLLNCACTDHKTTNDSPGAVSGSTENNKNHLGNDTFGINFGKTPQQAPASASRQLDDSPVQGARPEIKTQVAATEKGADLITRGGVENKENLLSARVGGWLASSEATTKRSRVSCFLSAVVKDKRHVRCIQKGKG